MRYVELCAGVGGMSRDAMKPCIPEHLREPHPLAYRLSVLQHWANGVRGLFGVPVYLCGSALLDSNAHPRDWDIRLMLPDEDFRKHVGDPALWEREGASGQYTEIRWRWSAVCVKQSKQAWNETGLNIDFQIYPFDYCRRRYLRNPRLQLDPGPQEMQEVE